MFVIAIILAVIGVIAVVVALFAQYKLIPGIIAAVGILGGILFTILSSTYQQDTGEAVVLRSWTGELSGYTTSEGLHSKAPWDDALYFDIRNQRVVYTGGNSEGDNSGGNSDGPQITVQDGEGVTANIDLAVRYSIQPDAVVDIYKEYGSEENLRTRLIFNDIRSAVRAVTGDFTTLELLTNRGEVQQSIFDALTREWRDEGIIVNDVALQEIRYGEAVTNAFASAQEAQIAVERAQAELERQQIEAQQLVQTAQAQADANAILNSQPLSEASLRLRYLETLEKLAAEGNLVVVPEGFNGLVNVR